MSDEENLFELRTKLRGRRADVSSRLNYVTSRLDAINTKIKLKKDKVYIFKPEEVEELLNNLSIEILMADTEDMIKIIDEMEKKIGLIADSETIAKCPYGDKCLTCVNHTNHCDNFIVDESGELKCFNYKLMEGKDKHIDDDKLERVSMRINEYLEKLEEERTFEEHLKHINRFVLPSFMKSLNEPQKKGLKEFGELTLKQLTQDDGN